MATDDLTPDELRFLREGGHHRVESPLPKSLPLQSASANPGEEAATSQNSTVISEFAAPAEFAQVCSQYAANLARELQSPMRSTVTVTAREVRAASRAEFVRELASPTFVQIYDAPACGGKILLELHPCLVFPMLDRLLGGGKMPPPVLRRPLTEIELRLVHRITQLFANQWSAVWQPQLNLQLEEDRVVSSPNQVPCEAAEEELFLIFLDIAFNGVRGPALLAVPKRLAEHLEATSGRP